MESHICLEVSLDIIVSNIEWSIAWKDNSLPLNALILMQLSLIFFLCFRHYFAWRWFSNALRNNLPILFWFLKIFHQNAPMIVVTTKRITGWTKFSMSFATTNSLILSLTYFTLNLTCLTLRLWYHCYKMKNAKTWSRTWFLFSLIMLKTDD